MFRKISRNIWENFEGKIATLREKFGKICVIWNNLMENLRKCDKISKKKF